MDKQMINGVDAFRAHFKMPKKEMNRIRKEYESAKEASDHANATLDLDKLKNFKDLAKEVFEFYTELTSRQVNHETMFGHLSYWFDEGYEVEEIKNYIREQKSSLYFQTNPEKFTIAFLFPIRDQDRINRVWDDLAYELAKLERSELLKKQVFSGIQIMRQGCGHSDTLERVRESLYCEQCGESELNCVIYPYQLLNIVSTNDLREVCWFFMRHNEESIDAYRERTRDRRVEIYQRLGLIK